MHARVHVLLAPRWCVAGRLAGRRRHQRRRFRPAGPWGERSNGLTTEEGRTVSSTLWGSSSTSPSRRQQHPGASFSSFHATVPSTSPSTAAAAAAASATSTDYGQNNNNNTDRDDHDDETIRLRLNDDIEAYSKACMTRLLPDEVFYRVGEEDAGLQAKGSHGHRRNGQRIDGSSSSLTTLDSELGVDSVWDASSSSSAGEACSVRDDGDDDDGIGVGAVVFDDDDPDDSHPARAAAGGGGGGARSGGRQEDVRRRPDAPQGSVDGRHRRPVRGEELPRRSAMEVLRNFDPDLPPAGDDKEELQLWLECFAQREAVRKHQQLVEMARDRKAFDSMSMMQRHIVQWFETLRDTIESRQRDYLLNQQTNRVAHKRYGPFLCSLHPEKMAVILSQEAIAQALMHSGKNGHDGVPLVKIAASIGSAVETEVVSQRRIKERFHSGLSSAAVVADPADPTHDDPDDRLDGTEFQSGNADDDDVESKPASNDVDRWKFSASHLKLFLEDIQKIGMGKGKRAINYAIRRAKLTMNNDETWTNDDIIHLGAALLSILVDHAKVYENGKEEPAFRVEKKWSHRTSKSVSYIVLHDKLLKVFLEDDYLSWAPNTTRHMPMIVPPSDWVGPKEGGYRWLEVDLMRTHGSSVQKEALEQADLSSVCDGLNILGKTAWKINKEILDVAEYCWQNNVPIGDIPSRTDFEVPPEPVRPPRVSPEIYSDKENPDSLTAMAANRSYRESMYKRQRIHQKNMDLRSLRCSAILKLNQAVRFKDAEKIYFPYNLDFRGRAYPVPPHLSNVGSDLCRGMLKFSDAKPLGKRGLYWLKVHLANFAGKDKMSFDDRAKYTDDNMQNVRDSIKHPFSENPWWMTLDDPFQGLATCHEIVRAIDSGNPESYMCSLPVHMDGSCNGLQHYAALGRDTVGGKAVNLLEGEGPEDVYVGVMHEVIRRVAEEAATDVGFDTANLDALSRTQKKLCKNNQAAKLVNGLIDRGVVKRTVMTSVYGVTYIGARQQIQEKIEEKLEEKGFDIDEMDREIFAAAGYLASVTMEVMGDLFQGAKKTKTWLADCARIISQEGHPVAWISPIGVPAIQPYRQRRPRTIVTVMQSVTIVDEDDDLQVHTSRQVTAFPPNYVHSLDSSHMLMTAMEMDRRGLAFSAVHDSFWTHPCDVDEMNEALRDCFVDLYSKPLLSDLKESWEIRYPDVEFPELPELGNLDLNQVKSATYFFQ